MTVVVKNRAFSAVSSFSWAIFAIIPNLQKKTLDCAFCARVITQIIHTPYTFNLILTAAYPPSLRDA